VEDLITVEQRMAAAEEDEDADGQDTTSEETTS
jgi:hypothetical protein